MRRADRSEMPEAVLVKMTPEVWKAIRARCAADARDGCEISPPEALRRMAIAEWTAAPPVPGGVGDSGIDPFPDDARVRALAPLRVVLVAFRDGDRWAGEVHGYTTDVDTGLPTRIRTRGWFAEETTAEDLHGLATTWFDHELREQLGMKPHGE